MNRTIWLIGLVLMFFFLNSSAILAQQLPPGVKLQVVKEFPASLVHGAKSIKQLLFTLEPGAKLDKFTPPGVHFCNALAGEAKVVLQGKTIIRKAGQQWVEEKGVPFSIVNEGSVSFVDSFIQIIS